MNIGLNNHYYEKVFSNFILKNRVYLAKFKKASLTLKFNKNKK